MTTIRIPRRFYDDHCDRDLEAPAVIRSTKQHYFIDAHDPHLSELASDAEFYAAEMDHDGGFLSGLIRSATATADAIRAARADLDLRT